MYFRPFKVFLVALVASTAAFGAGALRSFTTGGHTAYHLRVGTVEQGTRSVIAASYDGFVVCHASDGRLQWKTRVGGHFPFDLAIADVDGDGLDESFVATAAGVLYAIGHDGRVRWTFTSAAPLFQVCTARLPGGATVIATGGVEQVLYVLSPTGNVVRRMQTEHCIRHLRAGNISGEGRDHLAVSTTNRGLSGTLSLLLIDPADVSITWRQKNLGTFAHNSGKRFFSMAVVDLNGDGKDEIMLSNSWGEHGHVFAFDHAGKKVFDRSDPRIPNIPYRMNLLDPVRLPDDAFVIGHFGNVLVLYNLDGTCREVLTGPYSFADGVFDPVTRTYYLGSAVSGGDEIHALQLDHPDWKKAYAAIKPVGKLAVIEQNLRTLTQQVATFQAPAYQPKPRPITVIAREPPAADYRHLSFVRGTTLSQRFERQDELWNREIDRRRRYDMTPDEIAAAARKMEASGRGFVVWSGHGHAVHMPLPTFERMITAAPRTLWGLEFAEMEGVDEAMGEIVDQILVPLAKLCRTHGKKIIFRNKNIFWNGTCYVPFWRRALIDADCGDVFVPALEETNCRTQELSLAGQIGLWLSGSFDQWSCRMVTDNANFDRMWEWAGHQVLHHHLRHLVSRAALGADVFFNDIHQGPFGDALYAQLVPFYDLLEKGIVHVPSRDELLCVPDVHIGMRSPPSAEFIRHGINGHEYRFPRDTHPPMAFDRLDAYWAGAPLAEHDFSLYALGVDRRMCNYLPTLPHGMVAMGPEGGAGAGRRFRTEIVTDGRYFYSADGSRIEPADHRRVVEKTLQEAAARLPVRVSGDAHWSVARLDSTHVRITLIDSGYLDPAERHAEILFQHLDAVRCRDLLSGESLPITNRRVSATVPMGTLRILDVEHR